MKKVIGIIILIVGLALNVSAFADSKDSVKSRIDSLNEQYTQVTKQYAEVKSDVDRYTDMYKHASKMSMDSTELQDIDGKDENLNQTKKEAHESIIKLKEQIHAKLAPAKDKAMQLQEKRRQIKAELNKLTKARFKNSFGGIK